MQPAYLLRAAAAGRTSLLRAAARPAPPLMMMRPVKCFSTTVPRRSGDHAEETFEEFTAR